MARLRVTTGRRTVPVRFRLWVEVKIRKGEAASALDELLDETAGVPAQGSGFFFNDSTRDREYWFKTEADRAKAMTRLEAKLKQLGRWRGAKVRIPEPIK